MPNKNSSVVMTVAAERIEILFGLAEKSVKSNEKLSKNYIKDLRKISAHYKVKTPKRIRNLICTRCNLVLLPGYNATVRVVSSHKYVAYKCNTCGRETHISFVGR